MDAPISICTKEEQRSVIRFLWSEGVPGAEIHRRLSVQYGGNVLPRRSVYEWNEQFKSDRTSVEDEKRDGRPATATTDVNIDQVQTLILNNRRLTIDEVAYHMHISHGSAYEIVHNRLNFHKVCVRWVPKQLSDEHKRNRLRICQHLLDRHANEGDTFLKRIVTGDETWIHHFEPESKRQSMEWKHPQSPVKKKIQESTLCRKSDAHSFLGLTRANSGTLPGNRVNSKQ
ncbi:protein GVQW3-like [Macrobrachium rosenbergii]|uniref:protein GVQW3-like n=1 Tax=Macrobrachium rosenbergii TaxID=79674 RepID=UPI0034D45EE8